MFIPIVDIFVIFDKKGSGHTVNRPRIRFQPQWSHKGISEQLLPLFTIRKTWFNVKLTDSLKIRFKAFS